jgi:hypothetical protein
LGTMTFGVGGASARAPGQLNEEEAHALLDRFVAAGGNFIDTANMCVASGARTCPVALGFRGVRGDVGHGVWRHGQERCRGEGGGVGVAWGGGGGEMRADE